MSVDELLLSTGASLHCDEEQVYYIEINFFPQSSSLELQFEVCESSTCDEFFRAIENKQRSNVLFRKRTSRYNTVKHQPEIIVKVETKCSDMSPNVHYHNRQKLLDLPPGIIPFVYYQFRRSKCSTKIVENMPVEFYLDEILEPINYEIITCHLMLTLNPSSEGFYEHIKEKLTALRIYTYFPVYTKFMLVLQCSSKYELYDEIYNECDSARYSVPHTIEKCLQVKDIATLRSHRDYLWAIQQQIVQAQFMYQLGWSEKECFSRLQSIKPSGDDLIVPTNDVY